MNSISFFGASWSIRSIVLALILLPSGAFAEQLSVVSARWGAGSTKVDVTDKLRQKIVGGVLNLEASNSEFGDPIFGEVKTLWVHYQNPLGTFHLELREGMTVRLNTKSSVKGAPTATEPGFSHGGHGQGGFGFPFSRFSRGGGIPAELGSSPSQPTPKQEVEPEPQLAGTDTVVSEENRRMAEESQNRRVPPSKGEQGFLMRKISIPRENGSSIAPPGTRVTILATKEDTLLVECYGRRFEISSEDFTRSAEEAAPATLEFKQLAEEKKRLADEEKERLVAEAYTKEEQAKEYVRAERRREAQYAAEIREEQSKIAAYHSAREAAEARRFTLNTEINAINRQLNNPRLDFNVRQEQQKIRSAKEREMNAVQNPRSSDYYRYEPNRAPPP
jgi:hypothetical protein